MMREPWTAMGVAAHTDPGTGDMYYVQTLGRLKGAGSDSGSGQTLGGMGGGMGQVDCALVLQQLQKLQKLLQQDGAPVSASGPTPITPPTKPPTEAAEPKDPSPFFFTPFLPVGSGSGSGPAGSTSQPAITSTVTAPQLPLPPSLPPS